MQPIILFSSCKNEHEGGFAKYNGGYKLYNLWVKLLRQHGMQAYVVTHDGTYTPWMCEHQPHVSITTVSTWLDHGLDIRFVTGWLDSAEFISLANQFYFFDAELAYTSTVHRKLLDNYLGANKIKKIATHSRVQQAWYLMNYNIDAEFIPEWSDPDIWSAGSADRVPQTVGYMIESPQTEHEIRFIKLLCSKQKHNFVFQKISGSESEVIAQMNRCDFYVGMNLGKHPVWGEGCPRSQQEAMHAGCVVVAYDVRGNREYLHDGYNGVLVPTSRPDLLAEQLMHLSENLQKKEFLRKNSIHFARHAFGPAERYRPVIGFLDLPPGPKHAIITISDQSITRDVLEALIGATAFLGVDEIPVLTRYAAECRGAMVEIGSAFGASSTILLAYSAPPAFLYSIDPFIKDSMGDFASSAMICRNNVYSALQKLDRSEAFSRWTLLCDYSHNMTTRWHYGEIDLLFLDGDHQYPAVAKDFYDWAPRVACGGYILIHDSRREPDVTHTGFARGWPGPTQLAKELLSHRCVELVEEAFSLTVWRKTSFPCQACLEYPLP